MKDQRSYFEKADFQSDLPIQLLMAALGFALVLLELAVAQWPVFYGSAPNLSYLHLLYNHLSRQIYADFHDIFDWYHWRFSVVRSFGWAGNFLYVACLFDAASACSATAK